MLGSIDNILSTNSAPVSESISYLTLLPLGISITTLISSGGLFPALNASRGIILSTGVCVLFRLDVFLINWIIPFIGRIFVAHKHC